MAQTLFSTRLTLAKDINGVPVNTSIIKNPTQICYWITLSVDSGMQALSIPDEMQTVFFNYSENNSANVWVSTVPISGVLPPPAAFTKTEAQLQPGGFDVSNADSLYFLTDGTIQLGVTFYGPGQSSFVPLLPGTPLLTEGGDDLLTEDDLNILV
jgi:hypothetical protein